MSSTASRIWIAVQDPAVFIKIAGRANLSLGTDFKKVVCELYQKGYRQFVLDLTECPIMDSTFLGVLSGFACKGSPNGEAKDPMNIHLLNTNPRIADMLDNMAIANLFKTLTGAPGQAKYAEVPATVQTPLNQARCCLEAHETLMSLHPGNIEKFKDVTQFLAEDIKKLEQKPEPPENGASDNLEKGS